MIPSSSSSQARRSAAVLAAASLLLMLGSTVAFTTTLPVPFTSTRPAAAAAAVTRLHVLLSPHELTDLVVQQASSHSWLLADAATTTATPATTDVGWWGQYINIFKASLEFVHSTIEQPLKSMGVEQTWGPSIAIFTMCAYLHVCCCCCLRVCARALIYKND